MARRRRSDSHRIIRWLWTSNRIDAKAARLALLPASGLWYLAMSLRTHAFSRGWLPARSLPLPSVAVGNLTVGGSGKTRLALQTAAETFDDFPDGVWIAEMAGLAEPERFPHWVSEEMGIARSAGATGLTGTADERSWIEVVIDYLEIGRAHV